MLRNTSNQLIEKYPSEPSGIFKTILILEEVPKAISKFASSMKSQQYSVPLSSILRFGGIEGVPPIVKSYIMSCLEKSGVEIYYKDTMRKKKYVVVKKEYAEHPPVIKPVLNLTMKMLLLLYEENRPLSCYEMADKLNTYSTHILRLMKQLKKQGLIRIVYKRHKRKKCKHAVLTEMGKWFVSRYLM